MVHLLTARRSLGRSARLQTLRAYYSSSSSSSNRSKGSRPMALTYSVSPVPQEFAESSFFALHRPLLDLKPFNRSKSFTFTLPPTGRPASRKTAKAPGQVAAAASFSKVQVSIVEEGASSPTHVGMQHGGQHQYANHRFAASLAAREEPAATDLDAGAAKALRESAADQPFWTGGKPFENLSTLSKFQVDPQVSALSQQLSQLRPFVAPAPPAAPRNLLGRGAKLANVSPPTRTQHHIFMPPSLEAPEEALIPEALRLGPLAPRIFNLDPTSPSALTPSPFDNPAFEPMAAEEAAEVVEEFFDAVEMQQEADFFITQKTSTLRRRFGYGMTTRPSPTKYTEEEGFEVAAEGETGAADLRQSSDTYVPVRRPSAPASRHVPTVYYEDRELAGQRTIHHQIARRVQLACRRTRQQRLLRSMDVRGSATLGRMSHPHFYAPLRRAKLIPATLRDLAARLHNPEVWWRDRQAVLQQYRENPNSTLGDGSGAPAVAPAVVYRMDSVLRKRRKKMNKHKHEKLRKRTRALRRRLRK
ncbi:hypothetical protein IWQ60_005631 [Tieghemiomyces parasiticus]|uniref:Small ribosomal subunit protein mS38 n=1 Tax=Tieghemiomyces parasiticus TaxID=78921 RepID=A0A9W8DSW9_9FUNG|nr:hypothetical protein IWQ60_005631 [Tieghemiomyces parasiticus]